MKLSELKAVMKKYGKAWELRDPEMLAECFVKSGTYQESPHAKPYRGHEGIKRFWRNIVVKRTKNIKFKTRSVYLSEDKKTGFAEWECVNNFKERGKWGTDHMYGIMILKMKGGKIVSLNEYWNTRRKMR